MEDENLRVAARPGADADGRDFELRGDVARDLVRDDFEDDGEGARLFERERVLDERARRVSRLRLQPVAAELVERLRREADVAHHGNLFLDEPPDHFEAAAPAFELDGLGAALLDEAQRGAHGVRLARVVGAVGHVGDQQRALDAAAHGARVVEHLFERDGHGRVVAEDDVAQASRRRG